jgi:hypothetical protein
MKITKVYETTPTLCKNGVTRPITRAYLETPCDICGQSMRIEKKVKGKQYKRAFVRWRCADAKCNHSKIGEGELDKAIRHGIADKKFGILKPHIDTGSVIYGQCVHGENMANCDECSGTYRANKII